jgi:hypothetical protein
MIPPQEDSPQKAELRQAKGEEISFIGPCVLGGDSGGTIVRVEGIDDQKD